MVRDQCRIGGHLGRFRLTLGRGDVLDPLLRKIGFGRALADREALRPLQAALFGDDRFHLGAGFFQNAGDPVADAAEGQHLTVVQGREGAAVVEEATDLAAQRHGLFLDRSPGRFVDVIGDRVSVQEAHLAQVRQVPVEVPDFAGQFRVPEHVVVGGFSFGQRVGVVGDTKEAEAGDQREQLAILPVAGELLEFGEVVVQRIVGRVQLFNIARTVQRLNVFGVRQDHVEGAGWGLRDQAKHVVAASVVFRHELHVVLGLELGHDIGLGMAIPSQHVQLDRLRICAAAKHRRRQRGGTSCKKGAACETGTRADHSSHQSLHCCRTFFGVVFDNARASQWICKMGF